MTEQGAGAARDAKIHMELAKASYERCCEAPDFFAAFYRNFFAACPEAEPRFADTDWEWQYKLLKHALGLLLIFPNQPDDAPSILRRVAERHSRRDLDVYPSLYPMWVDSMVATVKEFDTDFTMETEYAWRATLAKGVKYIISKY